MKSLVYRSDVIYDPRKIFSSDFPRTELEFLAKQREREGKGRGNRGARKSYTFGGNDTSWKVLTLSVRGFTRLLVLQGDKYQCSFRIHDNVHEAVLLFQDVGT